MFKNLSTFSLTLFIACVLIIPAANAMKLKEYHQEIMTGDGAKVDCVACSCCHQEHKESVVYCNQCHEFEYPKMKR
ncbi:cytochrome c3 family protein [Shewanella sp. D64]|uniref:cytochrome c3 family protein n=1 Tax=unclassified Shewanella TaxID=196818 RepID=UPI0022BA366A|nr:MULTISPECIES: cytochrome c3 family protein [unclassified Shewanella]MEC4724682.1 cytochrome c3 family protein [Shewanella sp. D64]MEC4736524.1 cytochrome c3 family protein [Shewanella sp. E94]WBJ97423.1 cytochrome c3 family protein [Shewanella sp. MTB7]